MSDKTDKELRAKYNAGVKHAKEGAKPMSHFTKSHANAYSKGYNYGSAKTPSTIQEHEHPYWSGKS